MHKITFNLTWNEQLKYLRTTEFGLSIFVGILLYFAAWILSTKNVQNLNEVGKESDTNRRGNE